MRTISSSRCYGVVHSLEASAVVEESSRPSGSPPVDRSGIGLHSGSLWRYVLVDVEEVIGIVLPLDLNQPIIVLAVVDLDLAVVVVLHEVDVSARLRIRSHCLVVVAHPPDPLCILRGVVPRGEEHHPVSGLPVGEGRVAGADTMAS